MACSAKQRAHVDKRVQFTCVTNSMQRTYRGHVLNTGAAIQLAFVLGTRFGIVHPTMAGDFMAQWIADHTMGSTPEELALRHQRAMQACVWPLDWTPEEFDHMGDEDE